MLEGPDVSVDVSALMVAGDMARVLVRVLESCAPSAGDF